MASSIIHPYFSFLFFSFPLPGPSLWFCGGETVLWYDCYWTHKPDLGQSKDCFLETLSETIWSKLILSFWHKAVYLSPVSQIMLVPGTGQCPDLGKHIRHFPSLGLIMYQYPPPSHPVLYHSWYQVAWRISTLSCSLPRHTSYVTFP